MKKPKCPCGKNCKERNAVCHGRCEKYSVYEKKLHAWYEEKHQEKLGMKIFESDHQL